jgi:hypothetical protein
MKITPITFSDKHKVVLWTPQRTGSTHATFIFTHFDFMTIFYSEETAEFGKKSDINSIRHHHSCRLFDFHQNYDVIMTTRNPYSKFISAFFYYSDMHNRGTSINDFRKFFVKETDNPSVFHHSYQGYETIPKYFLRIENLYEDYQKILFIKNSKLNECGLLKDLCEKKLNKNYNIDNKKLSTKDFFTMDMIDYFYTTFRNAFDIDGYDKDSYKEFI